MGLNEVPRQPEANLVSAQPDSAAKALAQPATDSLVHETEPGRLVSLDQASLLEAVPDAMIGVDRAGVIRIINHQAEGLFGYSRADLIGQPIELLMPESLRVAHFEHVAGYAPDLEPRTMGTGLNLTGRHRDGTEFPVDISLSPVGSEDILVIAMIRDLRFQRRAEQHRLRMAAIVEQADAAIIGTTTTGIVTSWNKAAEKLYGFRSEDIVGKSIELLSPPGRVKETRAILAGIRAGETLEQFEAFRVRRDGTLIPVSLTVSPIRGDYGVLVGAFTISRHLTRPSVG
jgi:PAS domain S-box-containing protein